MPWQETYSEWHWTWCYKRVWFVKVPYPCRQVRQVHGWCYAFDWIETVNYVVVARYRGCERDVMHEIGWKAVFFLGWTFAKEQPKPKVGTGYSPGGRFCYPSRLREVGRCQSFPPPPIG